MTTSYPPLALRMRDAAKALGCSTRTLHELVKRGEIRPRRLGTGPRAGLVFPLAELERWLREGAPRADGQGGVSDGQ
jgi:excisionase family DNA binding protein